ncbi:MAG: glycoside hydrolase family 2 [Bacteroidales bacterium]|nr:glycoside hydrolase family 2 [Bacteroidales bacterium]
MKTKFLKSRQFYVAAAIAIAGMSTLTAQQQWHADFSAPGAQLSTYGQGDCSVADGVLKSRGAVAVLGDSAWTDYSLRFEARVPEDADQVQIWAGFRTANRFDRYVVGIKGGLLDDLYLMRTGYMGMDEFMGVRPLGFHPVPGQWYSLRVDVCGKRIRVFVNDSTEPSIDLEDSHSDMAAAGPIALGGAWIENEFRNVTVTPLEPNALANVPRQEKSFAMTQGQKEQLRVEQRGAYQPVSVSDCSAPRTVVDLDGDWLFMPSYSMPEAAVASNPNTADEDWHVMSVPNFWNPSRIWLHGETMPSPTGVQSKGVSDTYYQRESQRCEDYTFDYRNTSYAWYRQWIDLPADAKGKQMTLHFDAVSKSAEVYVNGQLAGSHLGMFGDFDIDATPYLKPGRNLIAVGVARNLAGKEQQSSAAMENYYASVRKEAADNKDDAVANQKVINDVPHGFFQGNPAGIWQPVSLIITDPLRITDATIHPALDGAEFEVAIDNASTKNRKYALSLSVKDAADGSELYSGQVKAQSLKKGDNIIENFSISGLSPKLWSPESPTLYDFTFTLTDNKGRKIDSYTFTSGFRTFEAKGDYLCLNGKPYWLKGGNHIPFALGPNDQELAHNFMQWMKDGNINSTRTHTTPWNELWVTEADRMGIAISFEGTWSWLMIHSTPIPDQAILDLWADEWIDLIKKYRNHPSVCFWTVNNEMKFYDLDADTERAKQKMEIISDVVKRMREADPTRPICFDSNYLHRKAVNRFGADFMANIDDGDIDDNHAYYNWYDYSVFRFFDGLFQDENKWPGRPLISQEMSTGYPNGETGHPTRSYQLIHQNPYSLIGYEAYDWADPQQFLDVQGFITGELAEALRRTCPQGAGVMHFSYMTWFRQCYDAHSIQPYPAYYAMQRAMQPVLVSAEIWGRHLYAGQDFSPRVYVVNDDTDGQNLKDLRLSWSITDKSGRLLSQGTQDFPDVEYYQRKYITPRIDVPANLSAELQRASLNLKLSQDGKVISANQYDLTIGAAPESLATLTEGKKVMLVSDAASAPSLDAIGASYEVSSLESLEKGKAKYDLVVVSDIAAPTEAQAQALRRLVHSGAKVMLLNNPELAQMAYPEHITGWAKPTEGDIVVMERPEDQVFSGLSPLDLRYFNNNKREMPTACNAMIHCNRSPQVTELASHMRIHSYLDDSDLDARAKRIQELRGLTLLTIDDGPGTLLVSTMATEKAPTDPIAARLLANMINLNK